MVAHKHDVLQYKGKYYYRETLIQNVVNIDWKFVTLIRKWDDKYA